MSKKDNSVINIEEVKESKDKKTKEMEVNLLETIKNLKETVESITETVKGDGTPRVDPSYYFDKPKFDMSLTSLNNDMIKLEILIKVSKIADGVKIYSKDIDTDMLGFLNGDIVKIYEDVISRYEDNMDKIKEVLLLKNNIKISYEGLTFNILEIPEDGLIKVESKCNKLAVINIELLLDKNVKLIYNK